MLKTGSTILFNTIAPIYNLFFNYQVNTYRKIILSHKRLFAPSQTIIDVGCGTGALCFALDESALKVTGIEPAEKMFNIAKKRNIKKDIKFIQASILEPLTINSKSFDLSIASFVAHGMQKNERLRMYAEMSRITEQKVILYDYNANRSLITDIAEWMERGDYFNFIKQVNSELNENFKNVEIIQVNKSSSLYVCTPY